MSWSPRPTAWIFAALLAAAAAAGHAVAVADIPSPRHQGGWAVDLTGRIPAADLSQIDRIAAQVKETTGGELAVVVVGSTDGVPSRTFANDLFNRWGIGSRKRDDGALLFTALDDRKVEIILGNGFSRKKFNPIRQAIVDEEIVPRMKRRDPGGALREGTRAMAERLFELSQDAAAAAPASPLIQFQPTQPTAGAPPLSSDAATAPPPSSGSGSGSESLTTALDSSAPVAAAPRTPPLSAGESVGATFGGCLLFLGLGVLVIGLPIVLWRRRHKCPQCGTKMVLLDEAQDDAHLSANERAEERVGSVDYQIWACPGCGFARKERDAKLLTRYSNCPSCGARTRTEVSTVLRRATYDYGGLVQVDEHCENCGYAQSYERTTPPEPRPEPSRTYSSSSSHWGSSSHGAAGVAAATAFAASSSSSFDSGSSSSDSGFGGGSSSDSGFSGGSSSDSSSGDTSGSGSW